MLQKDFLAHLYMLMFCFEVLMARKNTGRKKGIGMITKYTETVWNKTGHSYGLAGKSIGAAWAQIQPLGPHLWANEPSPACLQEEAGVGSRWSHNGTVGHPGFFFQGGRGNSGGAEEGPATTAPHLPPAQARLLLSPPPSSSS